MVQEMVGYGNIWGIIGNTESVEEIPTIPGKSPDLFQAR